MRQRDRREVAVVEEAALRARRVLPAEQPVRVHREGEVGRLLAGPRDAADQRDQRQRGHPRAADQAGLQHRAPRDPPLSRGFLLPGPLIRPDPAGPPPGGAWPACGGAKPARAVPARPAPGRSRRRAWPAWSRRLWQAVAAPAWPRSRAGPAGLPGRGVPGAAAGLAVAAGLAAAAVARRGCGPPGRCGAFVLPVMPRCQDEQARLPGPAGRALPDRPRPWVSRVVPPCRPCLA